MGDKLKENWLVIVFTVILTSFISIAFTSAAVKWGKIDDAVSETEFKIFLIEEEKRNEKVREDAIEYTNSSFNNHEAKEQLEFANVKLLIKGTQEQNDDILKSLNKIIDLSEKRITRLEDKVYE